MESSDKSTSRKRARVAAEPAPAVAPPAVPAAPADEPELVAPVPEADAPPADAGYFTRERLIARSERLLGVPSFVARGALHGETAEMTVDEARSAVARFQMAPIGTQEG